MDKNKLNLKLKIGLIKTTTKPKTPDANMETEIFRRSTSTPRSPPAGKPESRIDIACVEQRTLAKELAEIDRDYSVEDKSVLADIVKERTAVEFLFNENNKISKSAIKFILSKRSFLESKLYADRMEIEKFKATYQNKGSSKTYAQVLTHPVGQAAPAMIPGTEKKIRNEHEVVLIKPIEEKDKRNNEQIKQDLVKGLEGLRNKLKVKGIRQMRNKGIVVEVKDKRDVDLMKHTDLRKIGLKTEEPSKINPSLIIYDVESDLKPEDLKDDLINKNLDNLDESHGYGHIAKNCEATDQLCENCGSKEHLKATCTRGGTPSCINCVRNKRKETNYSIRSALCPEYKRHVDISAQD